MSGSIDTSKLDPATLAKHLANPEGEIGKAVTAILNQSNAGGYSAAFAKLGIEDGDRVIEIGFGNGREIPRVLSLAANLSYFGVDISQTMVTEAGEFNATSVNEGIVKLVCGLSSSIPAESNSFDKGFALNTIYFWKDPNKDLAELRRVLRPGGRLVLGALAPWSAEGRPVFKHGFLLYTESEIRDLLALAGFSRISVDTINETVTPPSGKPVNRDNFIVCAE